MQLVAGKILSGNLDLGGLPKSQTGFGLDRHRIFERLVSNITGLVESSSAKGSKGLLRVLRIGQIHIGKLRASFNPKPLGGKIEVTAVYIKCISILWGWTYSN